MNRENEAKLKALLIDTVSKVFDGDNIELLYGVYWSENLVAYSVDAMVSVLLAAQEASIEQQEMLEMD